MKDDAKEADELANELIYRVEKVLENAEPSQDREALETKFERLKSRWAVVKNKVSDRNTEMKEKAPILHDYHECVDDFVTSLGELEGKISSQKPVSCDTKVLVKQVAQMEALEAAYENLKPEVVTSLANQIINSQPDDVYVVEAQLQYVMKMWENVTLCLRERRDHIKRTTELADDFQKAERPLRALYGWVEEAFLPVESIAPNIERATQELSNSKVQSECSFLLTNAARCCRFVKPPLHLVTLTLIVISIRCLIIMLLLNRLKKSLELILR